MKLFTPLGLACLLFATRSRAQQAPPITDCTFLGPVYPVPSNLTGSKAIRDAQASFTQLFEEAIKNGSTSWGPVNAANTTISLGVFSTQSNQLLAEFHHIGSAPGIKSHLTGGVVDKNTIYRTGSVGKLLTVYTFLAKLGPKYWDEPVSRYIYELSNHPVTNAVRNFNWSEVTLGSLAGQMSGLPRDYALADLSAMPGMTALGFPRLNASEVTVCGAVGETPCSTEVVFSEILQQNPLAAAWQTPLYSNEAYQLLAMAYENITGETFSDAFRTGILEPLKLKRTSWTPPSNDSNMVWVDSKGVSTYEADLGGEDPAGGTWTSLGDFAELGRSMLQSTLLPEYVTREWFKPNSLSNDPYSAVGKPWEIFSMDVPVSPSSKATRLVSLYTKNGGLGGYNGEIILDPDHGIGIVVLVASLDPSDEGGSTIWSLSELATRTWIPAAEAAARNAAAANYAGTFISQDGLNSTISLALVPDYTGLRVTKMVYNNTDFLQLMSENFGYAGASLQYMSLQDDGQLAFRANFQQPKTKRDGIFMRDCNAYWSAVDIYKWGNIGLDEVIVTVDKSGKASGIEMPALRTNFSKRMG